MDSLTITALFFISVLGIFCGVQEVASENDCSSNDVLELRNKITDLESTIQVMSVVFENKMEMLIKRMTVKSESRINALEGKLASTNQLLSKAIKDIASMENNYMLSNGTYDRIRESMMTGDANSRELHSVHKMDRRLLIPGGTTGTNINSVAFSATMTKHQENLGINQVVRFDHVITNAGSGFDPVSGIFRPPVSGLYFFTVVIMSHAGEDIETEIVKNGTPLLNTYSGDSTTWNQGSQSIVVHLNVGDDVYIHIHNNPQVNDGNIRVYGYNWSSFSGFLISRID